MTRIHSQGRSSRFSVPLLGRLLGLRGNAVLNDTLAGYILEHTRHFQSIIEVGAGPGALSQSLLHRFREYIILDKSGLALDVSRRLSPGIKQIHADILDFYTRERFDAVFSVGLADHFQEKDLHRLIIKHIEMASGEGSIFIGVRAFDPKAGPLAEIRRGVPERFPVDPRSEYKLAAWLKAHGLCFQKHYFDTIPQNSPWNRFIRRFNIILYSLTKWNLEKFYPKDKGSFVLFLIDKSDVKASCYFEQKYI